MSKDTLDFPAPFASLEESEIICPVTGTYCTGHFCEDYKCAKEAGFWDEDDNAL